MPDRDLRVREGALPAPDYDRLVFRQAVAVAAAKDVLLVDAAAVRDALAVFVRVDEKTIVPAEAPSTSSFSRHRDRLLVAVDVPGAEFAPVEPARTGAAGGTVHALGILMELGSDVRTGKASLPAEAGGRCGGLLPGEGAAPVLDDAGRLAGFLAGKTDVTLEGGGPDRPVPPEELADLLARAARSSRSSGAASAPASSEPAAGGVLVVYAVAAESLAQPKR